MRILLDESVPGRLGPLWVGHAVNSVQRIGWAGIKNGRRSARSNRMEDIVSAVPAILVALAELQPRTLRKVAG